MIFFNMPKANSQPKTWRKVKLGEFVNVNPSVSLQRGKEYPFLDMADVTPLSRTIDWQKRKVFNGSGARFENGDTLFARITPCLENGKITQARNLTRPAFGSTEFYVLRGRQGVSESNFISYLFRTYKIRKLAEGSMIGASGRQRVERAAFENIEVEVPRSIDTQRRIADVLSAFDKKIELNNKINQNLEQMAQAIFKEWFIVPIKRSRLPQGWETKNIMEIIKRLPMGKKYDNRTALLKGNVPILDQGQSGIIGFHNDEPSVKASIKNPVAIFSNHTCYYRLITYNFSCIQNVIPYVGVNGFPTIFIYYLTKNKIKMGDYKGHWPEFAAQKFIVPTKELAVKFSEKIKPFVELVSKNEAENQKLAILRDLLLPKLMSGEIKI
ncbi:MAG: restriction endonuclease subunit S [Caldisericia bacterium]|nr:restriction endonuclease subunit S [Caldisericia bacterium]